MTEDIREAMDRRELTVLTLLDFSKAFDTVDHDLLKQKLKHLYLSDIAVMWFDSYLRERQQHVSLNNRSSSWLCVKVGVPHGSVLGPLLFSIYINNVSTVLKYCRYHLYADDLQIYLHSLPDSLNDCVTKLNADLLAIFNWSSRFGLNLNPIKSQAILLGQQRLLTTIDMSILPNIVINNVTIPYTSSVLNLGLFLDSNLNWETQVKHICRKTFSILYSLRRLKNFLPIPLKQTLVQNLVLPHFDYCDIVYSDLNVNLSQRLQRVHNACIRFIFNARRYDHFNNLSWLRLNKRCQLHSLTFLFKILHSCIPN